MSGRLCAMPRSREPLPVQLPDAFGVAEALGLGIGRDRLLRDDLERVFRGGRVRRVAGSESDAGAPWERLAGDVDRGIRAYAPVMPGHAFFCGPTAARLWDIPVPMRVGSTLHVGVWRPRTAPVRPGVTGRQFTVGFVNVVELDGRRVTDPASTWASLGGLLTEDELTAAADRLLRTPRHPGGFRPDVESALATREELAAVVARKGRPGAPALRQALERARDGASSPPETQIRLILTRAHLPEPSLDVDVYDDLGRFLGCSELAYPDLKVAIEYESDGHLTRQQLQRDIDKYQAYAEAGWDVVRLTSAHVYTHPRETIRRVRAARAAATARLFLPHAAYRAAETRLGQK